MTSLSPEKWHFCQIQVQSASSCVIPSGAMQSLNTPQFVFRNCDAIADIIVHDPHRICTGVHFELGGVWELLSREDDGSFHVRGFTTAQPMLVVAMPWTLEVLHITTKTSNDPVLVTWQAYCYAPEERQRIATTSHMIHHPEFTCTYKNGFMVKIKN